METNSRYKFVDDLTALEKINLLLIGMASHNLKHKIPNDIISSNLIIPPQNLKSQKLHTTVDKKPKFDYK